MRVAAVGNLLEHRLLVVQDVAVLIDIGEHHAGAQFDRAGVGRLLADDHPQQRGLAGAVGADQAHDRPARHVEGTIVDQVEELAAARESPCSTFRSVSTFSPSRGPGAIWMIVSLLASICWLASWS